MLRRSACLSSKWGANSHVSVIPSKFSKNVMPLQYQTDTILTVPSPAKKPRHVCSDPSDVHVPKFKELVELNDTDKCTICSLVMNDPYIGPCGHSYCCDCIKSYDKCPTCGEEIKKLVPNKILKEVLEKFWQQRQQVQDESNSVSRVKNVLEHIYSGKIELNQVFLDQLAELIAKKEKDKKVVDIQSQYLFLSELLERKINNIGLLEMQVKIIKGDLADVKVKIKNATDMQGTNAPVMNSQQTSFIQSNFDGIMDNYIQLRMPDVNTANNNGVENWGNSLSELTKYVSFHKLASFNFNDTVCSMDFNKDEELFAAGGITKQLKVYVYQSIFDNSDIMKYPVQDMCCDGKITSISFNHFLRGELGFGSHNGAVTLPDIHAGSHLRIMKEHQDRCWAVHWNQHDTKMIASVSNDCTVKIWASNMGHSAGGIHAKGSVFTVCFHPTARYFLVHGCAENNVYYHDLRNTRNHLYVLKGHKNAITYCQFANDQELI